MIDNVMSCARALRISFEVLFKYSENKSYVLNELKKRIKTDDNLIELVIGSKNIIEINISKLVRSCFLVFETKKIKNKRVKIYMVKNNANNKR